MGDILRKPYEISVWEDVLVTENNVAYYKENKIAVIGSDTMDSPNRVYDPILHKNLNGEVTLSFSLKYKYFDPQVQKFVTNPFEGYLINERKVKLFYDNKWYDFIVRNHEESSDEYAWDYICQDAFILELSKNGYNVELDDSLGNNQGTATQLAKTILKDTDWTVDEEASDILRQFIEEPIYIARLGSDLTGIDIVNASDDGEDIPLPDSKVFVFYSYVTGEDGDFVQFIRPLDSDDFVPVGAEGLEVGPNRDIFVITTEEVVGVDDIGNIVATNFRINTPLYFDNSGDKPKFKADINGVKKDVLIIDELETKYHAYRLVYNQLTTYDPVMERTVDILNVEPEDTAYRYTDYTYSTSDVVLSYVTNGENFEQYNDGTPQGWSEYTDSVSLGKIGVSVFPKITNASDLLDLDKFAQSEGFLRVKFPGVKTLDNRNTIFNSGIEDNTAFIESVARGQKFVLRWRAGMANREDTDLANIQALGSNQFGAIVAKYKTELDGTGEHYIKSIDSDNIILEFNGSEAVLNNIINTGVFSQDYGEYIVDDVVQTPSSKYVYISIEDTRENPDQYVWDKVNQRFVRKTNSYIDYRYLVAEAQKSISNKELIDPTQHFGIFIYLRNGANANNWYFLQDVQLTRYIEDANKVPVTIGNIPTAQSYETEYYYLKPKEGQTKDDIELYTSLDAFARALNVKPEEITLAYNENSEKVLMITESHSNCFNILQTIAETFECWLKLEVAHDDDGAITLDENNRPIKKVLFKEFSGNDNFAGFKYGINLKAIQRTVDSDEIVTKLIVEQVQSEYTDNGMVSIRDANSNASGESYIFNFNYYYRNGLMDMATTRPQIEGYSLALKFLNDAVNELNNKKIDADASLIQLNSKRVDFTTLIETAQDNITKGKDEFKKATGQDYDDYRGKNITEDTYVLTTDEIVVRYRAYYKLEGGVYKPISRPTGNPQAEGWYVKVLDLLEDDKIVEIISEIYINSMMINNYSGILTNIEKEYKDLRFEVYGAEDYSFTVVIVDGKVRVNVSDYVVPFKFYYGSNEYETTLNKKTFDDIIYQSGYTLHDFTVPADYTIYTADDQVLTGDITPTADKVQKFKVKPADSGHGIQEQIDELLERKENLTKDFYKRFSRFIQEGTWSSNNYLNADMYYLDAMQMSNVSGQPKVSYSIDVAEVSTLAGLENYRFEVGDKTWIEDEEFFGWNPTLKAPTREQVIVSEVEWHLDDPSNNTIRIQNYKTQFEDLFQRISATVQSVQYNDNFYPKISAIVNPDGTLKQETLINALQATAGLKHNLTSDGSIYIDGDNIFIQNLTNTANRMVINSEGIRISDNGGLSWTTAISGRGINAETIYAGSIDTDHVTIGGTANPAFRWDKYGLSAFRSDDEGVYDLKTFVRFDEYGLYGIKDGADYIATDLEDIKNKAHFGVTWEGFFIKNSYTDGRVEITSDDDFQVIQTVNGVDKERIKIGALTFDSTGAPTSYGIRVKNLEGDETFVTDSATGNVTITGTINALGGNFTDLVTVGKKNETPEPNYIIIDGRQSLMRSSNYQDGAGAGWMINKDGDAVFNNITARGAIKTAVFEYAEIQAVGGVFLFRPSSTIKKARVSGNDLIVEVEKPFLFAIIKYNEVVNPSGNPKEQGWFEKTDYGYKETTDETVDFTKTYYTRTVVPHSWCKVSNYTGNGVEPDISSVLKNNGLVHVYEVINVDLNSKEVTLANGAQMVQGSSSVTTIEELEGGALVDMGREASSESYEGGRHNYGIGVNSSDNTVNLPARAISLFETVVDGSKSVKVTYNYRGILGTLPVLPTSQVSDLYHSNMTGTQGIYTDNMYIGDNSQYVAFYTVQQGQDQGKKKLKIRADSIEFGAPDGSGYIDVADGNKDVQITSSNGNIFKNGEGSTVLTCTVYQYDEDITAQVQTFAWKKNGVAIQGATSRTLTVTAGDVNSKAVYTCEVTF